MTLIFLIVSLIAYIASGNAGFWTLLALCILIDTLFFGD